MGDHIDRYRVAERRLWARYGPAPAERWVSVPPAGTRIRILETGAGRPVLFVHGVLLAGSEFAPLVGGLTGVHSILVDLPGSGLSDASPPGSVPAPGPVPAPGSARAPAPAFVDLLERVLDDLGLDRVAVVGHSFGGACALWLAAARPARVGRIVLEGCPALLAGARLTVPLRIAASGGLGRFLGRRRRVFAYPGQMMGQVGHAASARAGRIDPAWLDWYRSLALDTATMSGGTSLVQQIATARGMRPDLAFRPDVLAGISQPTLFVWGEDDPIGGVEVGRRAASAMPNATFRSFAASGHLPWLDDPAEHARLVGAFVAGEVTTDAATGDPDRSTSASATSAATG